MFCKAMASVLLFTLSLTLLGWGVKGQENGQSKVCSRAIKSLNFCSMDRFIFMILILLIVKLGSVTHAITSCK